MTALESKGKEMNELKEILSAYSPDHPANIYLKKLEESYDWLQCLEAAGVDNWEGCDMAHEIQEAE